MTIPVMIVNCLSVHVCPVVVFTVNRCVVILEFIFDICCLPTDVEDL